VTRHRTRTLNPDIRTDGYRLMLWSPGVVAGIVSPRFHTMVGSAFLTSWTRSQLARADRAISDKPDTGWARQEAAAVPRTGAPPLPESGEPENSMSRRVQVSDHFPTPPPAARSTTTIFIFLPPWPAPWKWPHAASHRPTPRG